MVRLVWAIILVAGLLALIAIPMISDWRDRKHGRRRRSSGELLSRRYEQRANLHAQQELGGQPQPGWDKLTSDDLKDRNAGGY
jgi:hypothetical protein